MTQMKNNNMKTNKELNIFLDRQYRSSIMSDLYENIQKIFLGVSQDDSNEKQTNKQISNF